MLTIAKSNYQKQKKFYELSNVLEQFWCYVKENPLAIALVDGEEALTRYEMFERSFLLSGYLSSLGVKSEKVVGLYLSSSIYAPIAIYGILSCGASYLPLSLEYPDDRIRYMIENAKCQFIFTEEIHKQRLKKIAPEGTQIVTIANLNAFEGIRGIVGAAEYIFSKIDPQSTAYVIYTSGTTGRPKGVKISHESICNQMLFLKETFNLDSMDRILQKTPLSFDAAQWELLAPSLGCLVVIGGADIYRRPKDLINLIKKFNITILQAVPTLLNSLISSLDFRKCLSLKFVFSGGEALTKSTARGILQSLPHCRLVNLYGPTECTINASSYEVQRSYLDFETEVISIGTPALNYEFKILNSHLEEVHKGDKGELIIGGIGVSTGYIRNDELNQKKFISFPHGTNKIFYRTGDIVFQDDLGHYHFSGRIDNQVKFRGYRIELDEIKSLIDQHPWVLNSAVIVRMDRLKKMEELEAFIELDSNEAYLMDQGKDLEHHRSKENKTQVKGQLKGLAIREISNPTIVYSLDTTLDTREKISYEVFARKSYRFFKGEPLKIEDVINLIKMRDDSAIYEPKKPSLKVLQEILSYFTIFESKERLLPKYAYASPGALYATQIYIEIPGEVDDCRPGIYYLNPKLRQLIWIGETKKSKESSLSLHFVGDLKTFIEVYENNVIEVLEFEVGHILGLFDRVLKRVGWSIGSGHYQNEFLPILGLSAHYHYLGSFDVHYNNLSRNIQNEVKVLIHPLNLGEENVKGTYEVRDNKVIKVSDETIEKNEVIAINQAIYQRSQFGLSLISLVNDSMNYIRLGRFLHKMQDNQLGIGLLSSGYSSKSGYDLPTALKINAILGEVCKASYFCLGGAISKEQILSRGMEEDIVHMKGPAELIKDDLKLRLPNFMVPSRVTILGQIPKTVNGKIDLKSLPTLEKSESKRGALPKTITQKKLIKLWGEILEVKETSIFIDDDFFALGGDSLKAVSLIDEIEKIFAIDISFVRFFESPTIEALSQYIDTPFKRAGKSDRLLKLNEIKEGTPVYFWPGLGGSCGGLKKLAEKISNPVYGVQLSGFHDKEAVFDNFNELAKEDLRLIEEHSKGKTVIFAGYSFGARSAFETAKRNSLMNISKLFLLAPGNPKTPYDDLGNEQEVSYCNPKFVSVLLSVFFRKIESEDIFEIMNYLGSKDTMISEVQSRFPGLSIDFIKRIFNIVEISYNMRNEEVDQFCSVKDVLVIPAKMDHLSFIDKFINDKQVNITVKKSVLNHYDILDYLTGDDLNLFLN